MPIWRVRHIPFLVQLSRKVWTSGLPNILDSSTSQLLPTSFHRLHGLPKSSPKLGCWDARRACEASKHFEPSEKALVPSWISSSLDPPWLQNFQKQSRHIELGNKLTYCTTYIVGWCGGLISLSSFVPESEHVNAFQHIVKLGLSTCQVWSSEDTTVSSENLLVLEDHNSSHPTSHLLVVLKVAKHPKTPRSQESAKLDCSEAILGEDLRFHHADPIFGEFSGFADPSLLFFKPSGVLSLST